MNSDATKSTATETTGETLARRGVGRPQSHGATVGIHVTLSTETAARLEAMAKRDHRSRSNQADYLLTKAMDAEDTVFKQPK